MRYARVNGGRLVVNQTGRCETRRRLVTGRPRLCNSKRLKRQSAGESPALSVVSAGQISGKEFTPDLGSVKASMIASAATINSLAKPGSTGATSFRTFS